MGSRAKPRRITLAGLRNFLVQMVIPFGKIVPDGAVNFGFMGEFVEIPRDVVFTTEYAVRSAMEAVYTLLKVDRGVPEVYGSIYDVRVLLKQMPQGEGAPQMPEGLAKQISEIEDIGWKNTVTMEDYKKRGMI